MKKIIALDIDGTLYNSQGKISDGTRAALLRAQQAGHILVLASGRPTAGLVVIAKELGMEQFHGLLLSYNGGMVTDLTSGEVLVRQTIEPALAQRLLAHLENFDVIPVVDDGYTIYTDKPDAPVIAYESSSNHMAVKTVAHVGNAVTFSPAKVLISAEPSIIAAQQTEFSAPFLDELSFIQSAPFYYEATPKGVHKADALARVCEVLGLGREDVIAFGDAQNDLSMLAFAGVGVAMGNACDELKAVADRVTCSNDEDGIAVALEELGI